MSSAFIGSGLLFEEDRFRLRQYHDRHGQSAVD
ncbi:hypothetical protein LPU83_pLPU83c_0453 (plasmid) [Rhizobium favelukesii]|uniref:Uncharacterized protein n=1 Tax=Rhizobium favelukesii TaxID=348824 RepID=W6RL99_9HYPH|nr:hypothetical protein LPU83_pLPU83c_0453 [Rhizobium favelukesii]